MSCPKNRHSTSLNTRYVMLYCVKVRNQLIRTRVLQQMKYVRQSCAKNSSPTIILNIRYYTVSTTRRGCRPVFPGEVVESSRIAEKNTYRDGATSSHGTDQSGYHTPSAAAAQQRGCRKVGHISSIQ